MPERLDHWTAWWRRRVPEPARSRAFDPSIADLERAWAARRPSPLVRRFAVARLAWQSRRLVAADEVQSVGERTLERMRAMVQDLRLALRRLSRQPAFMLTSVLTLALGIGANLAAGAYVYGFLLAPVNAPAADELVRVIRIAPSGASTEIVSYPLFADVRDAIDGVDLAAHTTATAQVGPPDAAEIRVVELVSGNYFRVLRQTPLAGRLLEDADDEAELAAPVVVLSEAYWRARLSGDPSVVGRTLRINGAPFQIVGIAAPGFHGTYQSARVDMWVPTAMQQVARPRDLSRDRRGWGWLRLIGRRDAGVSLAEVRARLDAAAEGYNRRFPADGDGQRLMFAVSDASALPRGEREQLTPVLGATLAFTGLLFLVTCANLAGVMQARLAARRRELAIRQSLGAGRRRLIGEWAAECLLIALGGGAAGLAAAWLVVSGLGGLRLPAQLVGNMSLATAIDWRLPASALGLSLVACALFGLAPAWRAGRHAPSAALRDGSGALTSGRSAVRVRRAAVVVQLALSGVLLLGAVLLGRSLGHQAGFDPGFETSRLALVNLDLARQRVPEAERAGLVRAALDRIRRDPGVVAAEAAASVPLGFGGDARGFRIPGYTPPNDRGFVVVDYNVVGSAYFDALGVPIARGRSWAPRPMPDGATEAVINETMARRFWDGRDPLGETIEMLPGVMLQVVGIVPDVAYYAIDDDPMPYIYLPGEAYAPSSVVIHVRTSEAPETVIGRLSQALPSVDERLTPDEAMTFEALRRIPLFPARFLAGAAFVFGGLALLLAAVGLYGVVTMSVGQRTREIGLRMALGARPGAVLVGLLRESAVLVAIGLVVAIVAGGLLAGSLEAWLVGVSPFDPIAALIVSTLLVTLALMATWLPARRAARIDPVVALRDG